MSEWSVPPEIVSTMVVHLLKWCLYMKAWIKKVHLIIQRNARRQQNREIIVWQLRYDVFLENLGFLAMHFTPSRKLGLRFSLDLLVCICYLLFMPPSFIILLHCSFWFQRQL